MNSHEDFYKKYGRHQWLPPHIEARDFRKDTPALRVGNSILVCWHEDPSEPDDDVKRLIQSLADGEDIAKMLWKFSKHCDTGVLRGRTDDTVTIQTIGGTVVTHRFEDVIAVVTRPNPKEETEDDDDEV